MYGSESSKENIASKAYITFKEYQQLLNFHTGFDGHLFRDKHGALGTELRILLTYISGRESRVSIEFAPFQKTPSAKQKPDHRQGTIDEGGRLIVISYALTHSQDPDFKSFLEALEVTPSKPDFEANLLASRTIEKPKQTPLLLHLAARKEKSKAKREKARQKQQRKAAEKNPTSSDPSGSSTPAKKAPNAPKQPRPKKTRGEKRAAKKVREGGAPQGEPQIAPPIKILARPDAPTAPSDLPSAAVSAVSTPGTPPLPTQHTEHTLDAPKGPRGGGKPRGRAPRAPRGRGRGRGKPMAGGAATPS